MSTTAASYRAGKAAQADLIMAQTAVLELRNRATEAAMQGRRARIALARYIGADADRPQGEAPDIARLPFDPDRLADIEAQPEIRLARAQESFAAADADIARASKQPDWSAEVSYAVRGSPYANMVSLMVSIDLPWSPGTRQDREHAAKLKELDAARAMREDALRMRRADVESMRAEWESAAHAGGAHPRRHAAAGGAAPRRGARGLSRRHRHARRGARRPARPARRAARPRPAGTGRRQGVGLARLRTCPPRRQS